MSAKAIAHAVALRKKQQKYTAAQRAAMKKRVNPTLN